jgi:hypothetical protein
MLNSISVRKAFDEINRNWFLSCEPQSPFDINTAEEERKICCIFDSLMRNFPTGIIILLKTKAPHYRFVEDYAKDYDISAEESINSDFVVWEGQEILQRLYSGINTFHGKVLCYDLLYDLNNNGYERHLTGFSFHKEDEELPWYYIKLRDFIFIKDNYDDIRNYFFAICKENKNKNHFNPALITSNLLGIWETFLNRDRRNLNYFVAYNFADAVDARFRLTFCTTPIITSAYLKNKKERTFDTLEIEKDYYHNPGIS